MLRHEEVWVEKSLISPYGFDNLASFSSELGPIGVIVKRVLLCVVRMQFQCQTHDTALPREKDFLFDALVR